MLESENLGSIDALLPRQMAEKAECIGVEKTRLDTMSLMTLGILAGAFIALDRCSPSWSQLVPKAFCPMV